MTERTSRELIGSRYEIVRRIGSGGAGTVWLAQDDLLGRYVAIKQLGAFPGETEGETRRAMREARSAAALNHPNVVAVHDVIEHDEVPWLVMEYVAGPTLASAIRDRGPMSPKGAADLGAQLAGALAATHRAGIVHRDIKPANVHIGDGRPKIGDFGVARPTVEEQLSRTGAVAGTPSYMSPEVAMGGRHTGAADVWALGATIYFAVEGHEPFPRLDDPLATLQYIATNPPRTPQRAGPLEPVLADMLSRDPARRGSMLGIARRLEHLAAGGQGLPPTDPGNGQPTAEADEPQAADRSAPAKATSAPLRPADPPPQMHMVTEPPRASGGATVTWIFAIMLALLLGAAALFLFSGGDDAPQGGEEATTTSATTEAESPDASPTEEDAVSFTQRAGSFVQGYYGRVVTEPDSAWGNLTEAAQDEAGGRSDYEDFWEDVESVDTKDLVVDAAEQTVRLTVTYTKTDGETSTERITHHLTQEDGQLKIDE